MTRDARGREVIIAPTLPGSNVLVIPSDHPSVIGVREKIATVVREIGDLEVISPTAKTAAVNLLSAIQRVKGDAEHARLGFVEPLKKYTAGVDKLFRETLAPLLLADGQLRQKVIAYDSEQRALAAEMAAREEAERLRSEALLRQAERAEAKGETVVAGQLLDQAATADTNATTAAAAIVPPPPKTFSTPFGARATSRTVMDFEITNLAEIPREYLILDEARVRREIASGVLRQLDGLRIFERQALSVRA